MDISDFGYDGNGTGYSEEELKEPPVDINSGKPNNTQGNEDADDINTKTPPLDNNNNNNNNSDEENKDKEGKDKGDEEKTTSLEVGTVIEVDDNKYTVDDKGNILDDKGNIFKTAEEAKEWIESFEKVEQPSDKDNTIEAIQKAVDVIITDDNDKPIEYENTPDGIAKYVNDVIETGREEIAEAAINTLYQTFPFVKPMLDYYVANGRSLDGYNQIPDRSGIEVNENDVNQQEAIIRVAWSEDNRTGDVNSYIEYLKNANKLAETAKTELEGLKTKDAAIKKQLEEAAIKKHQEEVEESEKYWNNVKSIIASKKLGEYQIPDTITVEREGKKVNLSPNDFFNYLYRTDKNGQTAYVRDLLNETPESRLNDELLRAYLKFTGGSYSNLVDMAINEKQVKTLKLRAATNKSRSTMRITKPNNNNKDSNSETFGY